MTSPEDGEVASIVAILSFGETSIPVRVRSLTSSEARVQAVVLPEAGTPIVLKRGKLNAAGNVAWISEDEAGLSFRWPIDVLSWLRRWHDQTHNHGLVVGLGEFPDNVSQLRTAPHAPDSLAAAADELRRLRLGVEKLGDSLTQDIILVATHPEIQFLDEAMQRLERVAQALHRLGDTE